MAWIEMILEDKATGEVKELYDERIRKRGFVSNSVKIMSLWPKAMRAVEDLRIALQTDYDKIDRRRQEMIATAVSGINHCGF